MERYLLFDLILIIAYSTSQRNYRFKQAYRNILNYLLAGKKTPPLYWKIS